MTNVDLVPCGLGPHAYPTITYGEDFQYGPYVASSNAERRVRSPLTVSVKSPGVAVCRLDSARPSTLELRRGLAGSVDGQPFVVHRNGMRWRRSQRLVIASGADFALHMTHVGRADIIDTDDGERRFESWPTARIAPDLPAWEAAVIIGLLVAEIPDTTSVLRAIAQGL